ncbi:hypothetical protein [Paenibacillus larvae]|uniref:hypothetical protein n=1 Tax=Paenibacillus larvae TaxID=1464 RepID=UPI0035A7147A
MRERNGISEQGKQIVQDFIHSLTIHEDLNPKTLKEYASDLKHFIGWFETAISNQEETSFFELRCGYSNINTIPGKPSQKKCGIETSDH